MLLYVHRNHMAHWDGEPRTATSTFTQLLISERGGPSVQGLALQIIRAIKLPPNQEKRKDDRKEKVKWSWSWNTHSTLGYKVNVQQQRKPNEMVSF